MSLLLRIQRTEKIRVAPGFATVDRELSAAGGILPHGAYTVDALAKFLGEIKEDSGAATESFKATFGALEPMDGNKS